MVRLVAASRTKDTIHPDVLSHCPPLDEHDGLHFTMPTLADLKDKRVVVSTLSIASKLSYALNTPRGFFDLIVMDEAGQAPEPEAVAVLASLLDPAHGQLVLAGDPKQLGPIIHGDMCKRLGLEMSLLERLFHRIVYQRRLDKDDVNAFDPRVLTKLIRNYRSHEDILHIPSQLFYDGALMPLADVPYRTSMVNWTHLPTRGVPLIFHAVTGTDDREGNSPSWFNTAEICVVRDYVQHVLGNRRLAVSPDQIGIITPYQKQVQKIKQLLQRPNVFQGIAGKDVSRIMVGSAEQFQGQEKRVIILSTVRSSKEYLEFDSRHALGFLTNPKRFNVAVTRAQCMLIVVGNPNVLSCCPNWYALLQFCRDKKAWRGNPGPESLGPRDGAATPSSPYGSSRRGAGHGTENDPSTALDTMFNQLNEAMSRMTTLPPEEDDDSEDDVEDEEYGVVPSKMIQHMPIGFVRNE
eukprot:m.186395 g.186395  ORF g.186395 m.186395 type:complete len:464 (+) comp16756_c0_seq1:295-1686(+)